MQHGYGKARPWRVRKSGWYYLSLAATVLGALILLFLAMTALVTLVNDKTFWTPVEGLDELCTKSGHACSVLQSLIMPFLTLSLATVAYLSFRFTRVRREYLRRAREESHELVETAGGIFGRVVGRDQLCEVLMEDQRDSRFRRTHVVVGGVGTGKTALIVLLTEQLARRKALPVPLRLRNAEKGLDSGSWPRTGSPGRCRVTSVPTPRRRRCGAGCASRDGSSSSRTAWRRR